MRLSSYIIFIVIILNKKFGALVAVLGDIWG